MVDVLTRASPEQQVAHQRQDKPEDAGRFGPVPGIVTIQLQSAHSDFETQHRVSGRRARAVPVEQDPAHEARVRPQISHERDKIQV